jgi:hypothetical protein
VTLSLRPMAEEDLPGIAAWLCMPHVARWWTPDTTAEAELARYRKRIRPDGLSDTVMPGDAPIAIYRLPAAPAGRVAAS